MKREIWETFWPKSGIAQPDHDNCRMSFIINDLMLKGRSRGGIDLRQLELFHGPRRGALVRYYISCWSNVTVLGGRYVVFVHALPSRSSGRQFSELDGRTAHHFYAPERTYRDVKSD